LRHLHAHDETELLNKKLKEAHGSLMLVYNTLNKSYDCAAEQGSCPSEMSVRMRIFGFSGKLDLKICATCRCLTRRSC
jgi:hypothetical protein